MTFAGELARLKELAARFDDEALVAFANVGLLRRARKLLEPDEPTLGEGAEGGLEASGDGWSVRIRRGGALTTARCDCPSAGPCQHVVAVILALRERTTATAAGPAVAATLLQALEAMEWERVREWCGGPAFEWARARVVELEDHGVSVESATYVTVRLPVPLPTVRFMAFDLDAATVDPAGRNDRRVVALAVLLLRRRAGLPMPDLLHRAPPVGSDRRRPLADLVALTHDALRLGLLHLPTSFLARMESAAAAARGSGWYRVAALTERAVAEADALDGHHAAADTAILLSVLAEIAVVAEAIIRSVDADEPIPSALVGSARAVHERIADLDLLGCGHVRWGDALFGGTTVVLADVASARVFTVTVVSHIRGMQQNEGLAWTGAPALGQLSGMRVRLSGARATADLRLSNGASTIARVSSPATSTAWADHVWDGEPPAPRSRMLGRDGARWVRLCLEAHGDAHFDHIRQLLSWPVRSAGQEVLVQIPYRQHAGPALAALERVARQQPSHLVGRLFRSERGLLVEPVSAVVRDQLVVLADGVGGTQAPAPAMNQRLAQPATIDMMAALQSLAERGERSGAGSVGQLVHRAGDHGFSTHADVMRSAPTFAESLLRAAWVLGEYDAVEATERGSA